MERVTIFLVYRGIFGVSRKSKTRTVSGPRGSLEAALGREARSSPHLNKTAVSCVYLVQNKKEKERERKLSWQTITNRPGDKSLAITTRALLARLAGWLPKASSTSPTRRRRVRSNKMNTRTTCLHLVCVAFERYSGKLSQFSVFYNIVTIL